ncbi:MAG: extracellular solute-binding protein [Oscillospiraceae bacterium]|nr:extracellular solute-binding protein [Oscillospiraceae bacterium]
MKKILSLILAIMMMVSVLAGCSENDEPEVPEVPEEGNAIVVESVNRYLTAIVYDRGEDEPYDKQYWEGIVNNFEAANAGVTVNLIFTKDAAYEVRDRILSGNSPDFVFLPADEESGVTEALIKDKAMLALDDVAQGLDAIPFENSICKPYEDGIAYIAPVFFEQKGLIYNRELLAENGFIVPATWDDFIAIAKACENKKFEFFTYAGSQPDEFVDIFAAALVPAIGAEETGKLLSYDEEAWNREEVKTFIEKIEEVTKLVVSGSSTKSKADTLELLKDGKALFVSGTDADLEELNEENNEYAMCAYPALSGSQVKTVDFSEMYIPVEAKEPELAKEFIRSIYLDVFASSDYPNVMFAAEFAGKNAANESLSDEFCELVVDVFKGDVSSEDFAEEMLEYIEEY